MKNIAGIFKLVGAVILLPFVIGSTLAFMEIIKQVPVLRETFPLGVFSYTVFYLFCFGLDGIYKASQRVFSEIFSLFPQVANAAILVVPLLATLLLIILYLLNTVFDMSLPEKYFCFFTGFTLALHIIHTARDLFEEDPIGLKPNYFFNMSLTYMANLTVVMLLLNINFKNILIIRFFEDAFSRGLDIFTTFPEDIIVFLK